MSCVTHPSVGEELLGAQVVWGALVQCWILKLGVPLKSLPFVETQCPHGVGPDDLRLP